MVSDAAAEERRRRGFLPTLPSAFVSLGAGSLLASTLVTLFAAIFTLYHMQTGGGPVLGLAPYQVTLALYQFVFVTAVQGFGTYSAVHRKRWTFVMLAAILGSFAVITLPFTLVAMVTIGLSRPHFSTMGIPEAVRG